MSINKFGTYGTGTGTGQRGPRGPPGVMTVDAGLRLIDSNMSLDFDWHNLVNYHTSNTNPTVNDIAFPLGRIWVNTLNSKAYVLCSIVENMALWKEITNTTAEQLPPMTVYPDGSSIAMRDADGQSWFQNIYLKSLADGVNKKILKVSTDKILDMPTGKLVAESITGGDIDTTSDLNVHGLKVNGLGTGYLVSDATGAVTSQAVQIPADITVTSISGPNTGADPQFPVYSPVEFPNSLSTNFIQTHDQNKVEMHNDLHMYGLTSLYLENLANQNILSTDTNGKIIAGPAVDSTPTNSSIVKRTSDAYVSASKFLGDVQLPNNKINASSLGTDSNGNIISTTQSNTFTSIKTNTINPTTAATTPSGIESGTVAVNGDILINGGNELRFAQNSSTFPQLDTSKIVFNDNRHESPYKYYSIGANTIPKNSQYGIIFHSGGLNRGFEWMGMDHDGQAQATGDVSHMALINKTLFINSIDKYDGASLELKSALKLSGYSTTAGYLYRNSSGEIEIKTPDSGAVTNGSVVEINKPLMLTDDTIYTDAGYLYRNSDGTTEMKTPDEYTDTTTIITGTNSTSLVVQPNARTVTGNYNCIVGTTAGNNLTTGNDNTFIGTSAGAKNTAPANSIVIGAFTGNDTFATNTLTNSINIGNDGGNLDSLDYDGSTAEKAYIRIGQPNVQKATYIQGVYNAELVGGVAVFANPAGKIGTGSSSRRTKENIIDIPDSVSEIYQLNPVQFNYKLDPNKQHEFGLIAEDVETTLGSDFCLYNNDGVITNVKYLYIPILVLKELQKLKAENDNLKTQVATMQQQLNEIELIKQRITQLENNNVFYKTTEPQLSEIRPNNLIFFRDANTNNLGVAYRMTDGGAKISDL